MQKTDKEKQTEKSKRRFHSWLRDGIDSHNWATKMEIHRLISSKSDIKAVPR